MSNSIPPARTPLELQLQRRRLAFVRIFEMMCAFTRKNLVPGAVSSPEETEKLDMTIDEFFDSQATVIAIRSIEATKK